ncbi:MAG TPA: ABC transporter ATP-binding protein [Polyangiaceae bacterium]|nr:ABC transporter ATP-binding protein [Polyangiaceae bacterium]
MSRIERVVLERVVKTFGATAALRGVSASIEHGHLTLLEGANGSGKTTLLRIIGTVLAPTSGRVHYEPLGSEGSTVRAHVGWVSHEALAYGDLSGRENVDLVARVHGIDPADAWERARERFQLGRFAERPLRTNSRGQRQRVALARALVHRPTLVLLDEPTTGLDRAGVERLVEVIRQEVERDSVVVVVSHEPSLFEGLATQHLLLDRGKVVDVE